MKKFFRAFIVVAICLTVLVGLVSCGEEETTWKGYFVIKFSTGFDDVIVSDLIVDGKEPAKMPSDPIKAGYEFLGWYYDEAHTVPFSIGETPLDVTQDLTLYASWRQLGGKQPSGQPAEQDEVGFLYEKHGDEYALVGYDGESTALGVPATYKNLPVTMIFSGAFSDAVTKITIGKNVREIEEGALRRLTNLQEFAVHGENVCFVAEEGVLYARNKTSVVCVPQKINKETFVLPATVKGVAEYAFEGCSFDLTFALGGEYTEIDEYDLAGFAGRVTLGSTIAAIRRHAFSGAACEVTFAPDCPVDTLPMQSFAEYKGETLVLPGTIGNVEPYAFAGCEATVDISKLGWTEIGSHVFGRYAGKRLVVPATVTTIERYAFYDATCEVTFAFGSQYAAVTDYAFAGFGYGEKLSSDATVSPSGADSVVEIEGWGRVKLHGKVTFPSSVRRVSETAFFDACAVVAFENSRSDVTIAGDLVRFKGKIVYKND